MDALATSPADAQAAGTETHSAHTDPGFRERARMRRRARFLRKARELAYRDLGGLVFEMHRLGQRNDELVTAKVGVVGRLDGELRALEAALGEHLPVTVLREAGVAACPRCAAIHGSADRFCPACGMAMGQRADRPMAAAPVSATPAVASAPPAQAPAPPPAAAPPARAPAPQPAAPPARAPIPPPAATPPASTPETDRPTEIIRPPDGFR